MGQEKKEIELDKQVDLHPKVKFRDLSIMKHAQSGYSY